MRAQLERARAERAKVEQIRRLKNQLRGMDGSDSGESDSMSEADLKESILDMIMRGVGDSFPLSIRESAAEALRDGPQPDKECRAGCNWVGGIRFAWTSPPTVREVKQHVHQHFPRPIQPGDSLREIDGKSVDGLSRREILRLARRFKGNIGFRANHEETIRESAKDALKRGPQQDAEYAEGQNWIWVSSLLGHLHQRFVRSPKFKSISPSVSIQEMLYIKSRAMK